jgi:peptide/nickel transport system substrate-binding protein
MMLRGFRWQFLALLIAASVFAAIFILRSPGVSGELPATPTHQPSPPATIPSATSEPTSATEAGTIPDPQTPESGIMTYREALVGSVQRLNPLLAGLNPVDRDIASLIFEGLTRSNEYGEPVPALAKDWVISSDGLEYVITLRDDVLWQDGIPFSAADVVYTMSLLRSPDFTGPAALGAFWRTVETEKLGDYLVRFRLTQPLGSFLYALQVGILPAHALIGTSAAQLSGHPFNLSPIGTGPYQLEALRSTDGSTVQIVDLRVAPVYRQRPEGQTGFALERLSFHLFDTFEEAALALRSGQVVALAARNRSEHQSLLSASALKVYTAYDPSLGMVIFNWGKEDTRFFREQRVRVALEIGLDRTSIIERHLPNLAVRADSPVVPGSWAYSADMTWPPHDPARAQYWSRST